MLHPPVRIKTVFSENRDQHNRIHFVQHKGQIITFKSLPPMTAKQSWPRESNGAISSLPRKIASIPCRSTVLPERK
ncbi:MAG TPA: hypothetical protein DEF45_15380 [Rhodopirellula sp.]|nr:hypothetical protein [Rhodopirellula sp.]